MVFVPILFMLSMMLSWLPLARATTQITEVIPMIIPSIVRKERSLCAFIAPMLIARLSLSSAFSALRLFE